MKTKKDQVGFAQILMQRRRERDIHLAKAGKQSDSFAAFAAKSEIHKHKNVLFLSRGDDWAGTPHAVLAKSLFEIANHCLDDSDFVSLLDPEFLKTWTNGEMEVEKSVSENKCLGLVSINPTSSLQCFPLLKILFVNYLVCLFHQLSCRISL